MTTSETHCRIIQSANEAGCGNQLSGSIIATAEGK